MIGRAIRELLLADSTISGLVGQRITPAKRAQSSGFPSIYFGTDSMTALNCRNSNGTYTGTVEITIVSNDPAHVDVLNEAIRGLLDNQSASTSEYALAFQSGISNPDEEDENVYYQRLDFPAIAKRL